MPVAPDANGTRSVATLLRELAAGSADLARAEVQLARVEMGETARTAGRATAFVATGGVLMLVGALALFSGLVLLLGDQWLPRDLYWLSALFFTLVTGCLAAWLASRGRTMLSPSALAPHETVATLKEDKEWLKHPLRSGATSK